jgi:hypothetical protein
MGGRGGSGMPGMGRSGPSEDDMRRVRVIRRRLFEAPAQVVVVRDGDRVSMTDGEGRSVTYKADGRKEDRITGDGEFTSRAHLEGEVLAVEEDFGGGVKLVTRYAPIVSENRQRLEVSLEASGLPKPPAGANRPGGRTGPIDSVTRVYERMER